MSYNLFGYEPNTVLPIVLAVIIGVSLVIHIFQNL